MTATETDRQIEIDAEVYRYIRDSQNGECDDWTRWDADGSAELLVKLNAILRQPSRWTSTFIRRLKRVQAQILALEAIDEHIKRCAREHAAKCRENGRL